METLTCRKCRREKSEDEFYLTHLKTSKDRICRSCKQRRLRNSRRAKKQACVEYKGGCCEQCGYNKSLSALEFHHKDPTQKDFEVGAHYSASLERMITEAEKCMLVCRNCHAEIHEELRFLEEKREETDCGISV